MLALLRAGVEHDAGPFCLRYPRDAAPDVAATDGRRSTRCRTARGKCCARGSEVAILAVGTMVRTALAAAETLAAEGLERHGRELPLPQAVRRSDARRDPRRASADSRRRRGHGGQRLRRVHVAGDRAPRSGGARGGARRARPHHYAAPRARAARALRPRRGRASPSACARCSRARRSPGDPPRRRRAPRLRRASGGAATLQRLAPALGLELVVRGGAARRSPATAQLLERSDASSTRCSRSAATARCCAARASSRRTRCRSSASISGGSAFSPAATREQLETR